MMNLILQFEYIHPISIYYYDVNFGGETSQHKFNYKTTIFAVSMILKFPFVTLFCDAAPPFPSLLCFECPF
ncbi:hypothetical protein COCNU_01G018620 [Cocos nucifera]|uniref:Uncharacterized protein n=1 Tax=Cocos nucifera TaxID=13894 RepID=A0A8K0MVR4_COCNU|nr:hypothetical protein COCNU_01G018620 [Cocos nucifera]